MQLRVNQKIMFGSREMTCSVDLALVVRLLNLRLNASTFGKPVLTKKATPGNLSASRPLDTTHRAEEVPLAIDTTTRRNRVLTIS